MLTVRIEVRYRVFSFQNLIRVLQSWEEHESVGIATKLELRFVVTTSVAGEQSHLPTTRNQGWRVRSPSTQNEKCEAVV